MEKNEIIINNKLYSYTINWKNIKKIYLRIENGQIVVNAGTRYSLKDVEKLIKDNEKYVVSKIDSYEPNYNYEDKGFVYLFGEKYNIILEDVNKKTLLIKDNVIYVYHKNIQEVIEKHFRTLLNEYLNKRIHEYLHSSFDLPMPMIEIKKLKRRWGACFSLKNKVCFNYYLIHLNSNIIDYIIVHELCHFLVPNHSSLFYAEVKKRMPGYKVIEKELKEKHI